jgi:hypothetical protein
MVSASRMCYKCYFRSIEEFLSIYFIQHMHACRPGLSALCIWPASVGGMYTIVCSCAMVLRLYVRNCKPKCSALQFKPKSLLTLSRKAILERRGAGSLLERL